ncbi:hypothetical protein HAX54_040260, partial [Datura stramonium]|nr:hypothetical protein [Datura stramonium]
SPDFDHYNHFMDNIDLDLDLVVEKVAPGIVDIDMEERAFMFVTTRAWTSDRDT